VFGNHAEIRPASTASTFFIQFEGRFFGTIAANANVCHSRLHACLPAAEPLSTLA
jgi:hypothetical protein